MLDLSYLTTRDIILENTYTSLPVFMDTVVNSGVIPQKRVSTESVVLPDLSTPLFEINGKWVYGSDVQTFYKSEGGQTNLTAKWFAVKDTIIPEAVDKKVAPELKVAVEQDTLSNLKNIITLAKEKEFHDLATNTANYATGFWATPATKWDASSGTTIIDDIHQGILALLDVGVKPNVMIMPLRVWQRIKFAPEFQNVYVDRKAIEIDYLKSLFGIPTVVMPAVTTYGKPKKKSAYVPTDLWGDDVILMGNQPLGAGTYPSFVEAVLQPALVQRLPFDQEHMSYTIIAREARGYNFIKNNAAYLIHDVLS